MVIPFLQDNSEFPDCQLALADPDGLLCFGGDLSVKRLYAAYSKGIFPWYSEGDPILWWSPSERMVLYPENLHISKSFRKAIRKTQPKFYYNRNFEQVIIQCANIPRKDQGTWIHPEMVAAYIELFNAGHAFSLEVEINSQLAGGIYGVVVDSILCGESMFSLQSNGSKFAMYGLCNHMLKHGFKLLDCQLHNPHLESMGAKLIKRNEFLRYLPQPYSA
jgi:leucyl/phenylalanyl-tRNA--protein transferase